MQGPQMELENAHNPPALPSGDNVAFLDLFEAGGKVASHVLMALLHTGVLPDEVQVCATDDHAALHFGGNHHTPVNHEAANPANFNMHQYSTNTSETAQLQ